jgi:AcrR family transcriptional regulator
MKRVRKAIRRRVKKSQPVRARILQAAVDLVCKGGPGTATARAICQNARVTAPALYHHFGDLYGLFNEVLELMYVPEAVAHPKLELTDPRGMIDYMWDCCVDPATANPGLVELKNQLIAAGKIPASMLNFYARLEKAFEQLARRNALKFSPKMAATMFWAAASGIAMRIASAQHGGSPAYPNKVTETLKSIMLDAILLDADSKQSKAPSRLRAKGRTRAAPNSTASRRI